MTLSRRSFLRAGPALGGLALGAVAWRAGAQPATGQPAGAQPPASPPKQKMDKGPPLEAALVREFVGLAHSNLDQVRARLKDRPSLVNATWDWGGGDFETALGGASHMGRRDIAEFLLEHHARLDLFAAAMLGDLGTVKSALTARPALLRTPGPHGIPLIAHAKKGGEEARAVLEYLESLH